MALMVRLDEENEAAVEKEIERLKKDARLTVSGTAVANSLIREALDARTTAEKKTGRR